jgi:hypothetical protein
MEDSSKEDRSVIDVVLEKKPDVTNRAPGFF